MKKLIVIGLAIPALALAAAAMSSGGTSQAAVHVHPNRTASPTPQELAPMLADARIATAKYVDESPEGACRRLPDDRHAAHSRHGPSLHEPRTSRTSTSRGRRSSSTSSGDRSGNSLPSSGSSRRRPPNPAATRRGVRVLPRSLPLRRRHLRAGRGRGRLPAEEPDERREVRLLAPGPRDPPPLGLVPEPGRDLQRHQPARAAVQHADRQTCLDGWKRSPGPRAWAPCFQVTR